MRFAKYWAKGKSDWKCPNPQTWIREPLTCWGWSDISPEDAAARGRERAQEVARELQAGHRPDRYTYGDRPLKELILGKWENDAGELRVAITLNSYGCDVLNAAGAMFVDVDLDGEQNRPGRETHALGKLDNLLAREGGFGAHAYRTAGGLRYLVTMEGPVPVTEPVVAMMRELDSDPLYIHLCRVQQCYRARLTPKPWRCGMERIKIAYPFEDARAQASVDAWRGRYRKASGGYAVCRRLGYFGARHDGSEEFRRILEYHDAVTKAATDLPLA